MSKIPVGVLGATGMVGMQLVHLLQNHPYFELTFVAASQRSVGKRYVDLVNERWSHASSAPDMEVSSVEDISRALSVCKLIFSALSTQSAREWDERYAQAGLGVISNASAHRSCSDVPLLIPEVNPRHLDVLALQKKRRGWNGFLVCKPNCSLQSYMIALAPLHDLFGVRKVMVTTLQAISGAGCRHASELDIEDNVIPFIENEEEKSEREPLKIWGRVGEGGIEGDETMIISAHCNRVPVTDGHLACLSVSFEKKPSLEQIQAAWREFKPLPQELHLPSAPHPVIRFFEEENRPQTRLDRLEGEGMAISVGRLRACPLLDVRFVALSHNTVRGAAGGALLTAELIVKQGIHDKTQSDICATGRELSLSRD